MTAEALGTKRIVAMKDSWHGKRKRITTSTCSDLSYKNKSPMVQRTSAKIWRYS